jgi:hypothetical protein
MKEAGSSAPGLSFPYMFFSLEDPHDDGPQENKDTTYGENVELARHGSLLLFQGLNFALRRGGAQARNL